MSSRLDSVPFPSPILEQIARALCDTEGGLSNSKIDRALSALGIQELDKATGKYQKTKWRRVYDTLLGHQARSKSNQVVIRFIEHCLHPSHFTGAPADFNHLQAILNERLAFGGVHINDQGRVVAGKTAKTLSEAAQIADSMITELKRRSVHPTVLAYCDKELLQKDVFHGVHEATKGVFERLRRASGETVDGSDLIDKVMVIRDGVPIIAINNCETDSEVSEQKGFANLLRGAYGVWRNTTAHELRVASEMTRLEVLDALTTLSYIHRRLDSAMNTHTGEVVL